MILSDRWSREARKLIVFQKIVRIFRAWMGGNEIPACGGSGGFQFEARYKMLLQIFVILPAPVDRAFMSLAMASGVKRLKLFGILKDF